MWIVYLLFSDYMRKTWKTHYYKRKVYVWSPDLCIRCSDFAFFKENKYWHRMSFSFLSEQLLQTVILVPLLSITTQPHKSNFPLSQLHADTPQIIFIIFQSCFQLYMSAWYSDLKSWPLILDMISESSVKHCHTLCYKVADAVKRHCKMHSWVVMWWDFFFTICLLSGSLHTGIGGE